MRWRLLSQLNLINRHWAIGRDIHKWEFDRCQLAIGRRWPHRRLHPREKLRNRKREEYRIWFLDIYHTTKVLSMKLSLHWLSEKTKKFRALTFSCCIYSYTVLIVSTLGAAVKEHIQENTYKEWRKALEVSRMSDNNATHLWPSINQTLTSGETDEGWKFKMSHNQMRHRKRSVHIWSVSFAMKIFLFPHCLVGNGYCTIPLQIKYGLIYHCNLNAARK